MPAPFLLVNDLAGEKMNCEDLMSMKEIKKGIRLVAGESGVHRPIRWIYFADCVQCLNENYDIKDFIRGEELVIITNVSLTNDDKRIMKLIDVMFKKNIAGFVINEGQISPKIIDYCNEIQLPLFELSLDLHLIDLSQTVCKVLVQEATNISSIERLLSAILYSENLDAEIIIDQATSLDINLSGEQRAVVFVDEGSNKDIRNIDDIKNTIRRCFRSYGFKNIMMYSQATFIAVMVPSSMLSRDLLTSILEDIVRKVHIMYKTNMKVGIGTGYDYIREFRHSFQEAKNTIKVSMLLDSNKRVYYYEDLGLYSLLTQIQNGKFLDDYVQGHLGKLIEADMLQDGNLCETLECYIDNNCNANATAEMLYIHRNTMRYRMEKIKGILSNDIVDLSYAMELKLAFAIRKLRMAR